MKLGVSDDAQLDFPVCEMVLMIVLCLIALILRAYLIRTSKGSNRITILYDESK